MGALPIPTFTPAEYLEYDRRREDKFEYLDGVIIAMAGGSVRHGVLAGRVAMYLAQALIGKGCQPATSDVRVLLDAKRAYAYPDYAVICGAIEYAVNAPDTIVNPSLVVEVLSPATARYDVGEKAALYKALPSLQDLLLIGQEPVWIQHHRRISPTEWQMDLIEDRSASMYLQCLDAHLSAADIYAGTEMIPASPPQS